jgi:hypothetical protein
MLRPYKEASLALTCVWGKTKMAREDYEQANVYQVVVGDDGESYSVAAA